MSTIAPEILAIGGLRQDFFITHDQQVHLNRLGGNAVYSGAGARVWNAAVGLISRIGANFPPDWLDLLATKGFNLDGIRVLPDDHDTRTFYTYLNPETRSDTNPAAHFLRMGLPLPKELVGYQSSTEGQDELEHFAPLAIRPSDLPENASQAGGAHLAPADFLSHNVLPMHLRQLGVQYITLDPSERYMEPSFQKRLPSLINGLDAFLPSEAEARAFFLPLEPEIPEMAQAFAAMGVRTVVIKRAAQGQYLWDSQSGRGWHIPPYDARVRNVNGAGDSYCGGFLAGLLETQDPVEAALWGSVSASMTIEGNDALFPLDATPGLANARLVALRPMLRKA